MNTLIIAAQLSEPPTETFAFRDVTFVCRDQFSLDVLIEVEQAAKDMYYHYMKPLGLLDYTVGIITPNEKVHGLRLDIAPKQEPAIEIDKITLDNEKSVVGRISSLLTLSRIVNGVPV